MKKVSRFVGTTLTVLMAGALCTPVFAEGGEPTVPTGTAPVNKVFQAVHSGTSTKDTVSFIAEFKGTTADLGTDETVPNITVESKEIETNEDAKIKRPFNVTLPTYSHPGEYTYEISEVAGKVAGVTYSTKKVEYVVIVTSDDDGNLTAAGAVKASGETKNDTFTNTYSASSLNVTKEVAGNLGDRNKEFAFTIELTAEEGKQINGTSTVTVGGTSVDDVKWENGKAIVTGSIKNKGVITITNLPEGTKYTVVENDENQSGYKTTYDNKQNGTIKDADVTTVVTNTKDSKVDTGIITNNMPYILVCAGVLAAGVYAFVKRRNSFNH